MVRQFRVWEKKRGNRSTGSHLLGSVGEGVFSGILFLVGAILLTGWITSYVANPEPQLLRFGFGFWLTMLTFASILLLGAGGVIRTLLSGWTSAERRSALAQKGRHLELIRELPPKEFPSVPSDSNMRNSPGVRLNFRLPANQSTAWRLIAAIAFCLIWNGAAAVLIVLAGQSFFGGQPAWFLALFTIPFAIIGGWAIFDFIRQILIHTGIGPTIVEISDHPLLPGEEYKLYLSQAGRLSVRFLTLNLVCEEKATFRQGTDMRTEVKRVFDRQLLRKTDFGISPGIPFECECSVLIPPDAMHSFQSEHNAVNWKLVVHANAESWPPFERTFSLIVHPC